MGDHTTADDASRYRPTDELETWQQRDPIVRLRRYLEPAGLWDEAQEEALAAAVSQWVDQQVAALEAMPPQDSDDLFTSMYAELPPNLQEQMVALREEVTS